MKHASLWVVAVCALVSACDGSNPPIATSCTAPVSVTVDSTARVELVQARDAVWRAYYAGDSARLTELLPERMVGMGQDRAGIIAEAKQSAEGGTRLTGLEFTCDEFYLSGDVAVVFSHFRASVDRSGKPSVDAGRAIELFVRRDGKWVNPSWHLDYGKP